MKINCKSYNLILSKNERLLFNVGGNVSIIDISGEDGVRLGRLEKLKNPSSVAISLDQKLIAYNNTSGHIAVHNIESGELLLKSECISKEGYDLFFINNDKQIISSTWEGEIFILDIESSRISIVCELPISSTNIISSNNNSFIVIGSGLDVNTCFFELVLSEKTSYKELYSTSQYWIKGIGYTTLDNEIYLFANSSNFETSAIVKLNTLTNKLCFCFILEDVLGFKGDLLTEYGYFTSMCISRNGRYLLLGFSNSIIVIDMYNKKHISTTKMNYVSSLHFISSDTKVVIGTWTRIHIIDFSNFL